MLYNHPPTYATLKVFGFLALAYNITSHADKFNPRGVPCVFIGYPTTQKGYRLLNLLTNEVFVSRDVKWFENILPYTLSHAQLHHIIPSSTEHKTHPPPTWEDSSDDEPDNITPPPIPPDTPPSASIDTSPSSSSESTLSPPPQIRKSNRNTYPPSWLKDYVTPISNLSITPVHPQFTCFFIHSPKQP